MPHRRKRMVTLLFKLLLLGVGLFIFLRWFEQTNVYQPSRNWATDHPVEGHPPTNVVLTTSDGIELHGWFFKAAPGSLRSNQVIYLFHGNAGNLSHRGPVFATLLETGVNLLAIDYRGFGKSGGKPSEAGTYLDALAGYDWLLTQGFRPQDIIVHGESLGGGVASYLAASRTVGGLILQSSYTSLPDLGSELYPFLPVRTVGKIQYPTASRLPQIKVPVMIMHSRVDEVIPFHHSQTNLARANEPKFFWELRAGHNTYLSEDKANFALGLQSYLDRYFPCPAPSR